MRFVNSKIEFKDSPERKKLKIEYLLEVTKKVLAQESHGKLVFGDFLEEKSDKNSYIIKEDYSNQEVKLYYRNLKHLFFAYER